MGVARKWIFPILRLLVFAAIAAALVKIAFFGGLAEESDSVVPTGQIVDPQVAVEVGTIRNDVTLTGIVEADAAVPIKATLAGEVREVFVVPGQWVEAGTEILVIRREVPGELRADGTMGRNWFETETVTSPAAGTISSLPVIPAQMVSVGEAIGQVAPPSFHVSGTLDPAQQYRLLNRPTEATVTIPGGPAPFVCTGLSISTALAGAGSSADGGSAQSGTVLRCAVPGDVTVFAGLSAEVIVAGGIAENVLTIPVTAVEGRTQSGNVHVVLASGDTEVRPVVLGLNDGISVEITEGLKAGDLVLQFIPGAPALECTEPGAPGCGR